MTTIGLSMDNGMWLVDKMLEVGLIDIRLKSVIGKCVVERLDAGVRRIGAQHAPNIVSAGVYAPMVQHTVDDIYDIRCSLHCNQK